MQFLRVQAGRVRVGYAGVIATLALFVALGGTSVAAVSYINGKQIKPHSIPKNRLTNSAIAALHGVRGAQGIPGAQGPTGVRGPTGSRGTAGLRGATGLRGTTGLRGPTGLNGVTGPAGPSGRVTGQGFIPFATLANGVTFAGLCPFNSAPSRADDGFGDYVEIVLEGTASTGIDVFGFLSDNSVVHNVDVVDHAAWDLGDISTSNVDFSGMVALHGSGNFEHVAARGSALGTGNGCTFSWMVTP